MIYTNIAKIILYGLVVIVLISWLNLLISVRPPRFKTAINPEDIGLRYEDVSLKTDDGLTLKGWFIPANSSAAIIVGHGYPFDKGNVLPYASFLHKHYNLLFFDFRYFGSSEGSYTTVGFRERKDFEAAIDYLKKRNITDIGALGFSLSASTMIMTRSQDIKAIVADSPYAAIDNMIKQSYFIFPWILKMPFVYVTKLSAKLFFGVDMNDSPLKAMKTLKTPVLLIHGEKDSQINVKNSYELYEAADKSKVELWIVENADHGQAHALAPKEYEKRVMEFFDKYLIKNKVA